MSSKPPKSSKPAISSNQPIRDDPPTQEQAAEVSVQTAYSFSGPLPHPDALERYGQVIPSAPERILKMAEAEAANPQHLERWLVKGDVIRSQLGVVFAFLIGVIALGLGAYLVLENHDVAGTIFAGAGLTSLVGAFIYGTRFRQAKNDKNQP